MPPRGLVVAALVYLALRAALLAGRFDEVSNPAYELTMVGNLAHAVSTGHSALPLSGYFDNCGGHLVSGLLAAPLFLLVDDSYLVLKLVPLLQGLATLLLAWAIVAPRAGRAAATLACAAFALGPPLLARLSVMAMGNHFESLLPTFACYLAWLRWRERAGRADALVFGLVAGVAVFLYFGSLLWLGVLAAAHLRERGARATARDALGMAPGLALGLVPLVWIVAEVGGRVGGFFAYNLGRDARPGLGEGLRRAWSLASETLPASALYPSLGAVSGAWADGALCAAFSVAWFVVARASLCGDAPRTLPLVVYPPLLVLVLAFSRFDIEPAAGIEHATTHRYFAPYFGLFALTLGFAYGELERLGRPRFARALAGLVLATAPFALALALPSRTRGPSGAHFRGWSGEHLARLFLRDVRFDAASAGPSWDLELLARRVDALPADERGDVAFGLGYTVALLDPGDPFRPVAPIAAALPEALRPQVAEGMGAFLREALHTGRIGPEDLRRTFEQLQREHPREACAAARGLSREVQPAVGPRSPPAVLLALGLKDLLPPSLRDDWVQGLGLASQPP